MKYFKATLFPRIWIITHREKFFKCSSSWRMPVFLQNSLRWALSGPSCHFFDGFQAESFLEMKKIKQIECMKSSWLFMNNPEFQANSQKLDSKLARKPVTHNFSVFWEVLSCVNKFRFTRIPHLTENKLNEIFQSNLFFFESRSSLTDEQFFKCSSSWRMTLFLQNSLRYALSGPDCIFVIDFRPNPALKWRKLNKFNAWSLHDFSCTILSFKPIHENLDCKLAREPVTHNFQFSGKYYRVSASSDAHESLNLTHNKLNEIFQSNLFSLNLDPSLTEKNFSNVAHLGAWP